MPLLSLWNPLQHVAAPMSRNARPVSLFPLSLWWSCSTLKILVGFKAIKYAEYFIFIIYQLLQLITVNCWSVSWLSNTTWSRIFSVWWLTARLSPVLRLPSYFSTIGQPLIPISLIARFCSPSWPVRMFKNCRRHFITLIFNPLLRWPGSLHLPAGALP